MGLMQLLECDGCGKRTAAAGVLCVPADWRRLRVAPAAGRAEASRDVTLCGGCQASPAAVRRVLAGALGW